VSYEKWPIDHNHQTAVAQWENYPTVVRFLNLLYRAYNKALAIANRRAPYNRKYEEAPPWTPIVIRDLFLQTCGELIRTPQDLSRINTQLQEAIQRAEEADSSWLPDLLDIKQRINANFVRRLTT
jgi:hypothetical protein